MLSSKIYWLAEGYLKYKVHKMHWIYCYKHDLEPIIYFCLNSGFLLSIGSKQDVKAEMMGKKKVIGDLTINVYNRILGTDLCCDFIKEWFDVTYGFVKWPGSMISADLSKE